jgi:hypothetical protein
MTRHTLVIIRARDAQRREEALRGALGLTLRGATVEVWIEDEEELTALARRALSTLRSFGHRVVREGNADALNGVDMVEVWT